MTQLYFTEIEILAISLIPGHEAVGKIVKIGQNVKTLKVGQRVVCDTNSYCGVCKACTWVPIFGTKSCYLNSPNLFVVNNADPANRFTAKTWRPTA